jgi:CBS domain-containing protein
MVSLRNASDGSLKGVSNPISFIILKTREHSIMALLAVIVGITAGFGAVGFRYLINFFQWLGYGSSDTLLEVVRSVPWYSRIAIPALGGLLVGLMVYFLAREAKGHGVPEVMEAVALRGGIIRKRIVVIKSVASAICIGNGAFQALSGQLSGVCGADLSAGERVGIPPVCNAGIFLRPDCIHFSGCHGRRCFRYAGQRVFPKCHGIRTLKLIRRGIDIRAGREVNILKSIPVKDVMNTRVETVTEGMKMGEISGRVAKSKYNSFPMLDATGRLKGILIL